MRSCARSNRAKLFRSSRPFSKAVLRCRFLDRTFSDCEPRRFGRPSNHVVDVVVSEAYGTADLVVVDRSKLSLNRRVTQGSALTRSHSKVHGLSVDVIVVTGPARMGVDGSNGPVWLQIDGWQREVALFSRPDLRFLRRVYVRRNFVRVQ